MGLRHYMLKFRIPNAEISIETGDPDVKTMRIVFPALRTGHNKRV